MELEVNAIVGGKDFKDILSVKCLKHAEGAIIQGHINKGMV